MRINRMCPLPPPPPLSHPNSVNQSLTSSGQRARRIHQSVMEP